MFMDLICLNWFRWFSGRDCWSRFSRGSQAPRDFGYGLLVEDTQVTNH